jgi:hypothetical protein
LIDLRRVKEAYSDENIAKAILQLISEYEIARLRNGSGQPETIRSGFRSGPIRVEVFQGPDQGGPG